VKIVLSHSEELTAMNPDHYTVVKVKTGVKRDGRMTARYLQAIHGTGAYAGMKPGARQYRRRRLGDAVQDRQQLHGSFAGLHQHGALRFLARAGRDPGGVRF
jgi:hypothetical protein